MFDCRISFEQWASLSELEQAEIRGLVREFGHSWHCNWEFEYYSAEFTKENWLLANMAMPQVINNLQVKYNG